MTAIDAVADPALRADRVRSMFAGIAGRYDLANTVLSGGVHHLWRRRAVRALGLRPGARVLDVCCGTGDLAIALARRGIRVDAVDFCKEMVAIAAQKAAGLEVACAVGDATALPFPAASFDGATVAFGIRNVVDPVAGLRELARVVKPGGRVLVLEFGQPAGLLGVCFRLYQRHWMPRIGGLLTGDPEAYEYLPRTSQAFPAGARFLAEIGTPAGLTMRATALWGGVAWLYVGEVAE